CINIKNKKELIIFFTIIFCIFIFILKDKIFQNNNYYENITENNVFVENNKDEKIIDDNIKIHIYGEVNNPGLIELKVGSRIYDAIQTAGGLTEEADVSKINLAYILSDGEKIYIYSINDEDDLNETNYLIVQNTKVNINVATSEQLVTLPGIGDSLAEEIINYRLKNGNFSNIEDIKNVSGIGDNKFEKIKDFICVK
ncbi:MAG: hypothetical protein HFJ45_05270, partial [Clostridia bacterium]|nr:hypothetical protein [Clostridia bacterium]